MPTFLYALTTNNDPVQPGQTASFNLTVTNTGSTRQYMELDYTVPAYANGDSGTGTIFNSPGTSMRVNVGYVDPGASASQIVRLKVLTDAAPPDGTPITLTLLDEDRGAPVSRTVTVRFTPYVYGGATVTATQGKPFTYRIAATNYPSSYGASNLPAGLSINTKTGVISGTPTGTGTFSVSLSATNPAGTGIGTLTLVVKPGPPVITSAAAASGTQGQPFGYQTTVRYGATSYGASGLPTGLSINSSTGLISGTPTGSGVFAVVLSAANSVGSTTQNLTLTITAVRPAITSVLTASAILNRPFSYQITVTNLPSSYGAANLPAGLSVNTSTGLISGTPTAEGSYGIGLSATNAGGTGSATLTMVVKVALPFITSSLNPPSRAGVAFSYQIIASNSPTSYGATGLPPGLNINTTTGKISGTPTAAGTYSVVIEASNRGGTGSATLILVVKEAVPVITSALNAAGRQGVVFGYQVTATNSPTGYGATGLPSGLSVNATTGKVSGAPTTAGTYSIVIKAANSGGTGTATLKLTVAAPFKPVVSTAGGSGRQGAMFAYRIAASNDPTSYRATGLPRGLSVNTATGLISGTPTGYGAFTVTVSAANAGGTGTAAVTFTIAQAVPVITSATVAPGKVGAAFAYQIVARNTAASYAASGLPAGLTLDPKTGRISGTPTVAGTFAVGLSATNSGGTGRATLTLTVAINLPTVTLSVTTASVVAGGGGFGQFTLTLSAVQDHDVIVAYAVKGSAINGTDYVFLKGTKKFKAGRTSKPLKVFPLGDLGGASEKVVTLFLAPGDGYTVGNTNELNVKILAP